MRTDFPTDDPEVNAYRILTAVVVAVAACIFGSIVYRLAIAFALNADFIGLTSADLNLVTAVLVALALILPGARNPFKKMFARHSGGNQP